MAGAEPACDPAMMELFRAELDSHLPVLSEGLLSLEREGNQPKLLEAMMRSAHSIKGAARIVGMEAAVRISHVMEDCLVAAQKGEIQLGADAIDGLLRGLDLLVTTTQQDGGSADEAQIGKVVDTLMAVRSGKSVAVAKPAAPVTVKQTTTFFQPATMDAAGAARLLQDLTSALAQERKHFQFDLAKIHELAPVSLALLALLPRTPCADGSTPILAIENPTPAVRELLKLTGLDGLYTVSPAEER